MLKITKKSRTGRLLDKEVYYYAGEVLAAKSSYDPFFAKGAKENYVLEWYLGGFARKQVGALDHDHAEAKFDHRLQLWTERISHDAAVVRPVK
ncbi:hypothetical protein [Vibrio hepatarius]|uniref:hypothetical protein n=1 Tax=Vibrio hepatarius TaxID=171383 RepID=UPI001C099499|nr:hypothetical protein [Vibrio hepatarius]MBU2898236.1 hypothetical protein [Vibrio hepatarius]